MSVVEYYSFLVQLMNPLRQPLGELTFSLQVPFLVALLLGMLGALSPCQLSTNLAAFAFLSRNITDQNRVARGALAYLLGKVWVYSLVGGTAILLGVQLAQSAIPIVVVTRKILGPLLILLGLLMLGVVKISLPFLTRVAFDWRDRLSRVQGASGSRGAFLLGTIFSFAACPTLFLLFFGTLIPLALTATGIGFTYPAIFAVGTTLPLLFFVAVVALGASGVSPYVKHLRRANLVISRLAALVFILVGLNEIVLYWLV